MYNANATPESVTSFDMAQIQTSEYTILARHCRGTKSLLHESESLRERVRLKEFQCVLTFKFTHKSQYFQNVVRKARRVLMDYIDLQPKNCIGAFYGFIIFIFIRHCNPLLVDTILH